MIKAVKTLILCTSITVMTFTYLQAEENDTDNIIEMEKTIWNNKAMEEKREEEKAKLNGPYDSMARLIVEEERELEFGKCEKELIGENAEIDAEYDKASADNKTVTASDWQSRKLFGLSTADLEKTAGNIATAKAAIFNSTSGSGILSMIQSFKAW